MNVAQIHLDALECLYVPGEKRRAIIILHGYGANHQDLLPLHSYLDPQKKWDWFFPNGPIQLQMSPFFDSRAWFPINVVELEESIRLQKPRSFTDKYSKEHQSAVTIFNQVIEKLKAQYQTIMVGGFSQGGMVALHTQPVDGLVLLSTVLYDQTHLGLEKFKQLPVFLSHGMEDTVLAYGEGQRLKQFLDGQEAKVNWNPFHGGHEIPLTVLENLKQFLSSEVFE